MIKGYFLLLFILFHSVSFSQNENSTEEIDISRYNKMIRGSWKCVGMDLGESVPVEMEREVKEMLALLQFNFKRNGILLMQLPGKDESEKVSYKIKDDLLIVVSDLVEQMRITKLTDQELQLSPTAGTMNRLNFVKM